MIVLILGVAMFAVGVAAYRTKEVAAEELRKGPEAQTTSWPAEQVVAAYLFTIIGLVGIVVGLVLVLG